MQKKEIKLNNNEYEITKDEKECFIMEEVEPYFTDYFDKFDYVVGDFAYDKVRLKGFYTNKHKNASSINSIENVETYIENYCAYGAKYFILKKLDK